MNKVSNSHATAHYLWVVTEFKLGLATHVAAVARIFDDAGSTLSRLGALVRVARLAVAPRLLVLLPVLLLSGIVIVVVGWHLADDRTTQKAGNNR